MTDVNSTYRHNWGAIEQSATGTELQIILVWTYTHRAVESAVSRATADNQSDKIHLQSRGVTIISIRQVEMHRTKGACSKRECSAQIKGFGAVAAMPTGWEKWKTRDDTWKAAQLHLPTPGSTFSAFFNASCLSSGVMMCIGAPWSGNLSSWDLFSTDEFDPFSACSFSIVRGVQWTRSVIKGTQRLPTYRWTKIYATYRLLSYCEVEKFRIALGLHFDMGPPPSIFCIIRLYRFWWMAEDQAGNRLAALKSPWIPLRWANTINNMGKQASLQIFIVQTRHLCWRTDHILTAASHLTEKTSAGPAKNTETSHFTIRQ